MSSIHEVSPSHRDSEVPSNYLTRAAELPSYENVVQQPSDRYLHPDSAIHDEKPHPTDELPDSKDAPTHTTVPMPDENGFGKDAKLKAQEYHSDQIYPENRYGELGRADSAGAVPLLSDKIKEIEQGQPSN
ncbi:hypothetical protein BD410DRAFT_797920 [Rickenella mellea]|uniref:Uncharacterized protein n=1 Tax=Rickenella mellea TaxID=50990 RepID=A0A4R5XG08_9AGAM|nr:hypothetical protein BD410DRAFT_797920 [Rickenella mellea]